MPPCSALIQGQVKVGQTDREGSDKSLEYSVNANVEEWQVRDRCTKIKTMM